MEQGSVSEHPPTAECKHPLPSLKPPFETSKRCLSIPDFLSSRSERFYILDKSWIVQSGDGVVLNLHIVPRSSRTQICGEHGNALKIRLQAPPVEGKANKALIEFLSDTLDIARNRISILSGDTGRNKHVFIDALSPQQILKLLSR